MGQGLSAVLTFAVGVAISPIPIIAVILMLFSSRAKVNGPMFLLGWAGALAMVSFVVYFAAGATDPTTSDAAADTISWGKVVLGVLLLGMAARSWKQRPAPGEQPEMPKWMGGIDALAPGTALALGVLLAAVNPKNILLTIGAAAALATLGLSTSDGVAARVRRSGQRHHRSPGDLLPRGGDAARARLDEFKAWLGTHNDAVMTVLFLVVGGKLRSAKGLR